MTKLKDKNKKLTLKEQAFVDNFVFNAKEAALAAGYSKKTAAHTGWELLQKPHIIKALEDRGNERKDKAIADANEVLTFLTATMRENGKEKSKNNGGFDIEINIVEYKERLKAAELLGKSMAMFSEKIKHDFENLSKVSEEAAKTVKDILIG